MEFGNEEAVGGRLALRKGIGGASVIAGGNGVGPSTATLGSLLKKVDRWFVSAQDDSVFKRVLIEGADRRLLMERMAVASRGGPAYGI